MRYWEKFSRQFQYDLKTWLLMMLLLSGARATMLFLFRAEIAEGVTWSQLAACFGWGLRYDMMACTYWMLPCVLLSVLCGFIDLERMANRIRACVTGLYLVVTPLISSVSFEYYREFGDNFNQFLFNAWYDNKPAMLSSAWHDYHLLGHLLAGLAVMALTFVLWRKFGHGAFLAETTILKFSPGHASRLLVGSMIAVLIVGALRGSLTRKPVSDKNAVFSGNTLINRAAINPYMALSYAARVQWQVMGEGGLRVYLPDENIAAAVRELYPEAPAKQDLQQIIEQTAQGPLNEPPQHIFLLGMESYDAWPMMDKYRCLGLSEQLRGLAAEGLHIPAFLPSDDYSMRFMNTVVTGLPYCGVQTNWQRAAEKPFATSLPETMRKLGYRTRYFCGAPLDWQNSQYFCASQGFDEVYGSLDIVQGSDPTAVPNLWAARDELLWEFIASKTKPGEKTFTFVFSSSYHMPYDVDLEKAGCPLKAVPPELESEWTQPREELLRKLGHLWYADRELGKFVRRMEQEHPRCLFAITGDHFSRNFINSSPTPFERGCVPFVLYGKQVLAGIQLPTRVAGGHVDIPATLIELAAPRGFKYHALGRNLLAHQEEFFGYGAEGRIVGHDFIALADDPEKLYPIPGRELPPFLPDVDGMQRLANAARGTSWWLNKRGTQLPSPLPETERPREQFGIARNLDGQIR